MGGMNAMAAMKADNRIGVGAIVISTGDYVAFENGAPERNKNLSKTEFDEAINKLTALSVHTNTESFKKRPVIFCAGADDTAINPEYVRSTYNCLLKEYKKTGQEKDLEINIHAGTGHSSTPVMKAEIESFFRKYLKLK